MAKKKKPTAVKSPPMGKLTPRRLRFCQEYVKDQNGTQAAIRAGYAPKAAGVEGARLLVDVNVDAKIKELQAVIAEENKVDVQWVMDKFKQIAQRCLQEEPVTDKDGVPTGEYRFDSGGANKAIENLGKMIGAFEKDNRQKGVNILQQLNVATLPDTGLDSLVSHLTLRIKAAENKNGK